LAAGRHSAIAIHVILTLLLALAPAPPIPLPPPRPHGAALASYISAYDYPAGAIRRGEEGEVEVTIRVSPQGRVAACRASRSSGSAILDETTCRLLTERTRWVPARDAAGAPTSDMVVGRIRWRLPPR
jgi:TonB family protein